jgi:hypothetical protein
MWTRQHWLWDTEDGHCQSFFTSSVVLLGPSNIGWRSVERRDRHFKWSSEPLKSLTVCRCDCRGSTFSAVILRPWVLVRLGIEPRPPTQQTNVQPTRLTRQRFLICSVIDVECMSHASYSYGCGWLQVGTTMYKQCNIFFPIEAVCSLSYAATMTLANHYLHYCNVTFSAVLIVLNII